MKKTGKIDNKKIYILLGLLCVSIGLLLVLFYVMEPDYFWHIKAGEYMFKNGPITHDVFSWVANGKYWMSHEWLFEVILYVFKLVFGKYNTFAYCFVTSLGLMSIMFIYNRKQLTKNIPYFLLYITLFVSVSMAFIQARPHMISYSLLALTIWLLYDLYKNENSKKVFFLPLIAVLWSNIHGGSSNMVYILAFVFLFSGLFNIKFMNVESQRLTKKQIWKYLLVIVLCMVGICINIHGIKMLTYPYENMSNTTMINNINEWQPTTFNNAFNYCYLIFLVVVAILMLFSNKKIRLIDCLLFIATAFLGIRSIRFWLFCPIVMSFSIFDYFDERKLSKSTGTVLTIIIIGIMIMFASNYWKLGKIKYKIYLNDQIIKVLKKENPQRLYNMYNYGGELIYNDIKVFVDGRADLYSNYTFDDYLDITSCKNNTAELIYKYDFDYFLVDKQFAIYDCLKTTDFKVIYEDKKIIIYKKQLSN